MLQRGEPILYLGDRAVAWLTRRRIAMIYEDMPAFAGTEPDPITGRLIANRCWNGRHQEDGAARSQECIDEDCKCMCHDGRGWF